MAQDKANNPTGGPNPELIARLSKPWEEATPEEKCDKLAAELRQLYGIVNTVVNLQAEIHNLKLHHHVDGKVVVPMNTNPGGGFAGGQLSRRSYLD